jgi:hypothetical protein
METYTPTAEEIAFYESDIYKEATKPEEPTPKDLKYQRLEEKVKEKWEKNQKYLVEATQEIEKMKNGIKRLNELKPFGYEFNVRLIKSELKTLKSERLHISREEFRDFEIKGKNVEAIWKGKKYNKKSRVDYLIEQEEIDEWVKSNHTLDPDEVL